MRPDIRDLADDAGIPEVDIEALEETERDLEMAGDVADRWDLSTIDAMVWLWGEGYLESAEAPDDY